MSSRGVLYVVWDDDGWNSEEALARALPSIRRVHPTLPVEIARLPAGSNLLDKAKMNELSPFESTLFLDADTVVMGDLTYGFEQSERHGMACCICEFPWAARYPSIQGDLIEYNTGVIFWTKSEQNNAFFDEWKHKNANINSSITFQNKEGVWKKMPRNDQAGFALAIHELGINPFILPLNWNFRPLWHKAWFGPIKIWHQYSSPFAGIGEKRISEFFHINDETY